MVFFPICSSVNRLHEPRNPRNVGHLWLSAHCNTGNGFSFGLIRAPVPWLLRDPPSRTPTEFLALVPTALPRDVTEIRSSILLSANFEREDSFWRASRRARAFSGRLGLGPVFSIRWGLPHWKPQETEPETVLVVPLIMAFEFEILATWEVAATGASAGGAGT